MLASPAITQCGRRAAHCQLPTSIRRGWAALSFFFTSMDKLNQTAGLSSCCPRCSIRVRPLADSLQVIMLSKTLYFQWCSSRSPVAHTAPLICSFDVLSWGPSVRFISVCQCLSFPLCQFFILKPSLGQHPLVLSNSIPWGSSSTNLSNGTPNLLNINNWLVFCLSKCIHIKCECPSGQPNTKASTENKGKPQMFQRSLVFVCVCAWRNLVYILAS